MSIQAQQVRLLRRGDTASRQCCDGGLVPACVPRVVLQRELRVTIGYTDHAGYTRPTFYCLLCLS